LLTLLAWFSTSSRAEWPQSPQDFARLPRYCAARLVPQLAETERPRWEKRMGPDFLHIHHYCAAIHSLRLANAATTDHGRAELLNAVVGEIAYVEKLSKPTFFMRAEMSVQKGRAQLRLNQIPAAIQSFNAALKLNPRFPAAYAGIADGFLMLKQPAKAIQALDRGIKAVPNSKSLRQRRAAIK